MSALLIKELLALRTTTPEQIETGIVATLGAFGFPVTSWHSLSAPRRIIKALSAPISDAHRKVYQLAAAGYGKLARGLWLDLWAEDRFGYTRTGTGYTVGRVTLTDYGGGPHTINPSQHIVGTVDGSHQYEITDSLTLPLNGSASVAVRAVAPGAAFNVPNDAISALFTALPTVTVQNEALLPEESWITTPGADAETDPELYERSVSKWGELAITTPRLALASKVRAAVPSITKIGFNDDNPHGPGSLELVLANAAGPATAPEVAAAQALLDTLLIVGASSISAVAAQAYNLTISGEVTVVAAFLDAARAEVDENLADRVAGHEIGALLHHAQIIEDVMTPEGVTNVRTTTPTGDVAIGGLSVLTITNALTWRAI